MKLTHEQANRYFYDNFSPEAEYHRRTNQRIIPGSPYLRHPAIPGDENFQPNDIAKHHKKLSETNYDRNSDKRALLTNKPFVSLKQLEKYVHNPHHEEQQGNYNTMSRTKLNDSTLFENTRTNNPESKASLNTYTIP